MQLNNLLNLSKPKARIDGEVMKKIILLCIVLVTIFLGSLVNCQGGETVPFYAKIQKFNLTPLWISDTIMIEDGVETIPRPEPLGYIGEEYYRFYIHFISAQKDRKNPYQYIITGKTRIKDNIFTFRGIFKITDARIYKEGDVPGIRQGYVKGEYIFYEDRRQKGSGKLEGTFKSNFIIDRNNKLRYDALMLVADGFSNNQFVGTRKVYGSKEFQKWKL
jgi:hypothetical protein